VAALVGRGSLARAMASQQGDSGGGAWKFAVAGGVGLSVGAFLTYLISEETKTSGKGKKSLKGSKKKAKSSDVASAPPEFECPISHEIMREPVFTSDGYTFEHANITRWLTGSDKSPLTNLVLPSKVLRPNWNLRAQLEAYHSQMGKPLPPWDPPAEEALPTAPQPQGVPVQASGTFSGSVQVGGTLAMGAPGEQNVQLDMAATMQVVADMLLRNGPLLEAVIQAEPSRLGPIVAQHRSNPQSMIGALVAALFNPPGPALAHALTSMQQDPMALQQIQAAAMNAAAAAGMPAPAPPSPALMEAAQCIANGGDVTVLNRLLQADPSLSSATDTNGWTVLHHAAWNGNADAMGFLIQCGAVQGHFSLDLHAETPNRSTAMHFASWAGDAPCIKLLAEARADVMRRMQDGDTPLHQAAFRHNSEAAACLLQLKAAVDAVKENGSTSLTLAAAQGETSAQAAPAGHSRRGDQKATIQALLDAKADPTRVDYSGRSSLHAAAHSGNVEAVRLLAEHGADVNAGTFTGETAAHLAVHGGNASAIVEILEELAARGADLGAELQVVDRNPHPQMSALQLAVATNMPQVVELLLRCKASVTGADGDMMTPLHHAACIQESTEVVRMIVAAKADLEAKARLGCTPIHVAATSGQVGAMDVLINAKAQLDSVTRDGETPLHKVARAMPPPQAMQQLSAATTTAGARLLLRKRAQVDARRKDGNTALHLACLRGARDIAQVLIEGGAQRNAPNQASVTPGDLARQTRQPSIVSLFADA